MIFHDFGHIIWMLIFIPLVLWIYLKQHPQGHLTFSSLKQLKRLKPSVLVKAKHLLIVFRVLAICFLVLGLMRPQKGMEETKIETEGIDIVLAIDVSGSMMAEDFILNGERKNRLEAVKHVVRDFIKKRVNDRIGLVVFAGRAYMQCPLTLDYGILLKFMDKLQIGMIEDGTAVGDGLATALARVKDIQSKSKIVILLTDGVSNAGKIDPPNAAGLAKALKVKVYTIGAGSKGKVPFPAKDLFGNKVYQWGVIDLDEDSLQNIAQVTGGKYYRAKDTDSLKKIYKEIDRLEKTKIEVKSYTEYRELFTGFVLLALVLLLIEAGLRYTRFRTLP
ncbi:MAG: VWA domain-containing protein [PVC group bacterium]|nr:VWA domain-containing protein [PVC group bacterium]